MDDKSFKKGIVAIVCIVMLVGVVSLLHLQPATMHSNHWTPPTHSLAGQAMYHNHEGIPQSNAALEKYQILLGDCMSSCTAQGNELSQCESVCQQRHDYLLE